MHKLLFCLFTFFLVFSLHSKELSDGYKDIKLGMSKSEVVDRMKKSVEFRQKNDEVLSIRIDPDSEILTYEGLGFVEIGYFHFHNDKLFQILLKFDEKKIGYYLLLKNSTEKFGKPNSLDPKSAAWRNDNVSIVIEKPCTMKYFYLPVWNELIKKDQTPDDIILKNRTDFVNDL
jgi:hypothetical protein